MPENIARLLYIVRTLLEFARHLVATIERRAAMPGFSLFSALFGTAKLPIIRAHLHRGILRATALENLLLQRAATGQDVEAAPRHAAPGAPRADDSADPLNEPLNAQIERLIAERAKHDAPIDPDRLPTLEEIEAEVLRRPIDRTMTDICRDLGIVAGMCTRAFWGAVTEAVACYEGSAVSLSGNMQHTSEQCQREQRDAPEQEQGASLYPHQTLGFKIGKPPVDPFRDMPMPAKPRAGVPVPQVHATAKAKATGPPPRAAMKLAA
jgi:hypothetical protein